jgi:hypothetical protein
MYVNLNFGDLERGMNISFTRDRLLLNATTEVPDSSFLCSSPVTLETLFLAPNQFSCRKSVFSGEVKE